MTCVCVYCLWFSASCNMMWTTWRWCGVCDMSQRHMSRLDNTDIIAGFTTITIVLSISESRDHQVIPDNMLSVWPRFSAVTWQSACPWVSSLSCTQHSGMMLIQCIVAGEGYQPLVGLQDIRNLKHLTEDAVRDILRSTYRDSELKIVNMGQLTDMSGTNDAFNSSICSLEVSLLWCEMWWIQTVRILMAI